MSAYPIVNPYPLVLERGGGEAFEWVLRLAGDRRELPSSTLMALERWLGWKGTAWVAASFEGREGAHGNGKKGGRDVWRGEEEEKKGIK